jgi:hypothetical protein
MNTQGTLTEAIEKLRKEGYTVDFNLLEDSIVCKESNLQLFHDEFQVDKFFRFDGMTDPADEMIVYAISSEKSGTKGILVNGYGIYTDPMTNEMLAQLDIRKLI